MKNLVSIFEKLFNTNDEFKRQAQNYTRALKTEEWKFLVNAIQLIQGQMAVNMFSKKHTDLSKTEKDVVQKTYYNINQILDFLVSPQNWITRRNLIKQKLADLSKKQSSKMGGTTW